jgi:hypothetical protein
MQVENEDAAIDAIEDMSFRYFLRESDDLILELSDMADLAGVWADEFREEKNNRMVGVCNYMQRLTAMIAFMANAQREVATPPAVELSATPRT